MLRHLFPILIISVACLLSLVFIHEKILTDDKIDHAENLKRVHHDAVKEFRQSMNRFAVLMTGMRSYLHYSDKFPAQKQLQSFLRFQLQQLHFEDSLVVSYIDTNHKFIYSFTAQKIDPGNLIGRYVQQFRDSTEISRLDELIKTDSIKIFPPINLVEGWMGIPLNFNVSRNGKPTGYIASLINFRQIIAPIDSLVDAEKYVLKFTIENGNEFDRDQIYDGSEIYHDRIDSLSSFNFPIPEENYLTSKVDLYGQKFIIGTAYRHPFEQDEYLRNLFLFFYALVVGFSGWALFMNWKTQKLNQLMTEQNEELQALNKTKDRFFSIIGHDLRSPLGTIIGLMEIVQSGAISSEEAESLLKKLTPAAKNTIKLLEDLLKWAQINNNEISFNPEHTKIKEIITECEELLTPNADLKNIRINLISEYEGSAYVDKNMIKTIIRNLVSNAIKFSENDTEISIRTYSENDELLISIADQGIGMSDKEINEIYKLNHGSKRGTAGEQGSGLGITISLAFIQKHDGKLLVTSNENVGSVFKIILPLLNNDN